MIRRPAPADENGRVWDIADIRTQTARDLDAEYEQRGYEVFYQQDDFGQQTAGNPAIPGIRITPESALLCSSVCACVRVISETCAQLPLHLVKHLDAGGKQKEVANPLYRLLHTAPNKRHSSFAFRELMTSWCALYGNAYAEIVRVRGQITSLVPLHPSRMSVERMESKELRFRYNEPTGGTTFYSEDQILHLSWMSSDGLVGMMPVGLARDAIQMARACEIHGIGFFANSARPSVVLETEHSIPPEAQERLRESWERVHRGPAQAGKTAILPNGLKAHELGQSNSDQQYLELRQFQIAEIARVWRVPPHLVGDLSRATFSNIESQGLDFLNYCMMPWIRRWESAFTMALFPDTPELCVEFDVRGLMRADSATRAQYYSTMMNLGVYSLNECRDLETLPPVEGGDVRFVTLNVQTLDAAIAAAQKPAPEQPQPPSDDEQLLDGGEDAAEDEEEDAAESKRSLESRNCGTGKGGFQPGNNCAAGDDGESGDQQSEAFPQTKDAEAFLAARNKTDRPEMFSDYTPEQLAEMEMHLSADSKVGYLLTKEKHIGNVFNNGGPKGSGTLAVLDAIKRGAQTLDCYDAVLPSIYAKCGFVPTARIKFNDEFAPKNWDYEKYGRPDIVIMSYKGGDRSTIESRFGTFKPYDPKEGQYVDGNDWDSVVAAARAASEDSGSDRPEPRQGLRVLDGQADRGKRRRVARKQHRNARSASRDRRDVLTEILDDAIKRAKLFDALRQAGAAEREIPALADRALKRYKYLKSLSAGESRAEAVAEAPAAPGDNCGTGAGGFKPGNTCAKEDGEASDSPSESSGKMPQEAANCPAPCDMLAPVEDGGELRVASVNDEEYRDAFDWDAAAKIDGGEEEAITAYTGEEYEAMNQHIRDGGDLGDYSNGDEDPFNGLSSDELLERNGADTDTLVTDSNALEDINKLGPDIGEWQDAEQSVADIYENLRSNVIDEIADFDPSKGYTNMDVRADENTIYIPNAKDDQILELNSLAGTISELKSNTGYDSATELKDYIDGLVSDNTGSSEYDPEAEYVDYDGALEEAQQAYLESDDYSPRTNDLQDVENGIKSIAAIANPDSSNFVTWRTVGSNGYGRELAEKSKVGETLSESGFFSTSASASSAVAWKGMATKVLLRVVGRSGAPVDRISANKGEYEVLYPHEATFTITNIAKEVSVFAGGVEAKGVTVIDVIED